MKYLFVGIIFVLCSYNAYSTDVCRDILNSSLNGHDNDGIIFVPGNKINYDSLASNDNFNYYLDDIKLHLKDEGHVQFLSSLLSEKTNYNTVYDKLITSLNSNNGVVSLLDIIPRNLRSKTSQKVSCYEGNCFNAALRWHNKSLTGGLTSIKQVNDHIWFDYNFIYAGEKIRYGDLIVFRNKNLKESQNIMHTAIYLDQNLAWNKKGAGFNRPWVFEPLLNIMRTYYNISQGNIYIEYYRRK